METEKSNFAPDRLNFLKTGEIAEDVANLTGIEKQAVKSVLKGVSLILAHYIAEDTQKSEDPLKGATIEIPYIGTIIADYKHNKPSTKAIDFSLEFTETFQSYLFKAFKDGESPLEEAVVKKFVDVFLDKYKSVV